MEPLTPDLIEQLSQLLTASLSEPELRMIVYVATGDQLYDAFVDQNLPKRPKIVDLLIALEREEITDRFLSAVYVRKPFNKRLRKALEAVYPAVASQGDAPNTTLSVQKAGVQQAGEPTTAFAPGLQRNVRPNISMVSIGVWIERMTRIQRQVCRVEQDGNSLGTGFLVGPDAVLTNWHVVEAAATAGSAAKLGCRFDYLLLSDTSRQTGFVVAVHADGIVDNAPYSPAEATVTPDNPAPNDDELDYALLRLRDPIGADLRNGQGRGWISLPTTATIPKTDAPLLIVQHPDGGPMKLALDTAAIIGTVANGFRLRYHTNTDPGSSGSPCFSMDWELLALHHFGDPSWQKPVFNQGIPAHLIRNSITTHGHSAMLGGS
ncbi:serine protease [Mesorhizobium sp. M0633]|uniref:trypsin-like serine peptidase n=1 Tax=Mesorhizobium sp. M0633 TaxID=2956977 RepID=UPI0033390D3F